MADDVRLTDLEVIQRYSIAVRGETADRAELVEALRADLAFLEKARKSAPATKPAATKPAPEKPAPPKPGRYLAPRPTKSAPAKPAAKPAKPAAKKAPAKPAKKATRR